MLIWIRVKLLQRIPQIFSNTSTNYSNLQNMEILILFWLKKKCIFTSRSKIDFKADTRKSKLISCRSNILFEKGEKFSKFSKFSLKEERNKFTTKIYFSIRANWTSCIISNFLFPRISWQDHLSKRERERNRGRKRKLLRKVRWNSHCRSKISNVLDREESLT